MSSPRVSVVMATYQASHLLRYALESLRLSDFEDWEAIAVGPCGSRTCLFVGDIGDNKARRKHITIHRVTEPADLNGHPMVNGSSCGRSAR